MNLNITPYVNPFFASDSVSRLLFSQLLGIQPMSPSPRNYLENSMINRHEPNLPRWQQFSQRVRNLESCHTFLPLSGTTSMLTPGLIPKLVQPFQDFQNVLQRTVPLKNEVLKEQLHIVSKKIHKVEDLHPKAQESSVIKVKVWKPPSKKRFRRKACQVERSFKCEVPGCSKAYGYFFVIGYFSH